MIEPKIYCKVCGMTMQCIADFYKKNGRCPIVVEIGCADGQGTMRYAGFCEKVFCIDPMVSDRPDIFSTKLEKCSVDQKKLDDFRRRNAEFPIELLIGCSLWPEMIESLRGKLGSDKIDILVIDGCHHPFEAVWGDFAAYYPLVAKGGYVVFDDLYEDCIIQAYDQAKEKHGMIELERWSVRKPDILQDTGALIKTEE
mgnify:FL=1